MKTLLIGLTFLGFLFSVNSAHAELCGIEIKSQQRILKTVALFKSWRLQQETKIDQISTDAIFEYRCGADRAEGTSDDVPFKTFEKFVEVTSCPTAKLIELYNGNLAGPIGPSVPPLTSRFIALTFSNYTGGVGVSYGQATQKLAWDEAQRECGYGCFGAISGTGCLALAVSRQGIGYIGAGFDSMSALSNAMNGCFNLEKHSCDYITSVCTVH